MSWVPVGQGVRAFLWDTTGGRWDVFDPFDGKLLFSFENATAGTDWWWEDPVVFGEDGTMYVYILDGYANSLSVWNSTKAFEGNGLIYTGSEGLLRFAIKPGVYDWTKGIEWNVTIPDRNVGWHTPYSIFGVNDGVAIAKSGNGGNVVNFDIAYDTETGEELWIHEKDEAVQTFFSAVGEGVFASFDLTTRRWTGYDIHTGEKLWDSDQADYPWGTYLGYAPIIVYGKLIYGSFDGHVHAIDIETGKEVWRFYTGDSGKETVFGHWVPWCGPIVADGVVFVGTGEETPTQPLTRGNRVFALDAETGKCLWNISGYMSLRAIADGYLLGYNGYDSKIYCFGKGPSKTVVNAAPKVTSLGSSILIEGRVTDESTATKQSEITTRFPDGVPAIADEYMSAWMEYLYMQKPCPERLLGVQVKLTAVDPNGNTVDIGTVTSDGYGVFKKMWTPEVEGEYTIVASFEGSDSYWPSYAETAIGVGPSVTPETPIVPEPEQPLISTELAIVLAVVVIALLGIGGYWILRKRK